MHLSLKYWLTNKCFTNQISKKKIDFFLIQLFIIVFEFIDIIIKPNQ